MTSLWERLTSATDAVKRNTPDLSPVASVCRKTYDATTTTTVHVTRAVATKARNLHECLNDDQRRGDVTRVAKNLSVNGALYFVRSYGGGPIIDIVSRSWHDGKTDSQRERLKDLEAKVAKLEKELSSKKLSESLEMVPSKATASKSIDETAQSCAGATLRPETVLRNFMMHQFVGTRLFENIFVPGAAEPKKEKNLVPTTDEVSG